MYIIFSLYLNYFLFLFYLKNNNFHIFINILVYIYKLFIEEFHYYHFILFKHIFIYKKMRNIQNNNYSFIFL